MKMTAITVLASTVILAACQSAPAKKSVNDVQMNPESLLSFYKNYEKSIEDAGRQQEISVIRDEAMTIGTQAGYYYAVNEINTRLESRRQYLDQIDFKPLLIKQDRYYILPPVIKEDNGRKMIRDSGRYLRLIDQSYYLETEAKFVLSPPTWRDYLLLSAPVPNEPTEAWLPQDDQEQKIWDEALEQGFNTGIKQAQLTLRNKIAKLTSDYLGLIRYRILEEKNMVSSPQIKETYAPIVGGGQRLIIEDSTVKIQVHPQLNNNRYSWEVIPQLPDVSHLFPDEIYLNIME